jgi:hypothetical protein
MVDNYDRQLFRIYYQMAEVYAQSGRSAEAADGYALALYYARRLEDHKAEQECRTLVARHHPRHVAAGDKAEPLFFAQLLIRYPADEAQQFLQSYSDRRRQSASARSSYTVIASAAPFSPSLGVITTQPQPQGSIPALNTTVAVADGPGPTFTNPAPQPALAFEMAPTTPKNEPIVEQPSVLTHNDTITPTAPSPTAPATIEHHHVFDLGTRAASEQVESLRAVEDVLLRQSSDAEIDFDEPERSALASAINVVAACAVFIGFAAIGFFAYELNPIVSRWDLSGLVERIGQTQWADLLRQNRDSTDIADPAQRDETPAVDPNRSSIPETVRSTDTKRAGSTPQSAESGSGVPLQIGLDQRDGKPPAAR